LNWSAFNWIYLRCDSKSLSQRYEAREICGRACNKRNCLRIAQTICSTPTDSSILSFLCHDDRPFVIIWDCSWLYRLDFN
jgi:hypothetical protein